MKEPKAIEFSWVFFAVDAKPTSMRRAIAERLAQKEQVIIVDRAVSVSQERAIPSLRARALPLQGKKSIIHYWPLHFPEKLPGVGRIFKALNEKLIQREIDQLLPPQLDRIVCYDSPTQYCVVKKIGEKQSVYLVVDDRTLTVWGDPIPGEIEAEKRLLAKVDKVICVSETLADILRSRIPERKNFPLHVLPNGYDERIFDPHKDYQEPTPLRDVPRPRILIAGHLSERIDWDGITDASRLRPGWTWVFLGPADNGTGKKIKDILGDHGFCHPAVPVSEVSAWICHCDACAVPYRLNRFTLASHPLKAIEYLAMGAPVLSTRIPSLEGYHKGIEWVEEGDGLRYAKALDTFLQKEMQQKLMGFRQNIVKKETLGYKVDHFRHMVLSGLEW
jgi:glycosyltransferase involved in cell wall biosynthesis